jgi:hypothetical protein
MTEGNATPIVAEMPGTYGMIASPAPPWVQNMYVDAGRPAAGNGGDGAASSWGQHSHVAPVW